MPIRISAVPFGSAPYHDMLQLRRRLLREPLGLVLTAAQLEAERDQIHLALWHDEVVAGTLLAMCPNPEGTAKLRQMAVEPALQGQGLGSALVRHAEAMLKQLGSRRIVLSARETVIGFYERLGYRVEGDRYIEVTLPHVGMARALQPGPASRAAPSARPHPEAGNNRPRRRPEETTLEHRRFGKTGRMVSEIGFGAWAIGASWGHVDDGDALAALNQALDSGVTFIDTADVYGDGRSEQLIARVMRERGGERPFIATKAGRRLERQETAGYSRANLTGWIERSLANLQTDTLDLVQLHCPPTDLYQRPEVFGYLDDLKQEGKIRDYGVSVERIDEALKAIEYPGVVSIQIIYNIFRQRPQAELFERAKASDVAIIARVPLASGLLSGKFKADSAFEDSDHRKFNRNGEAFDVGETFSGVPYEVGLQAVERIRPLVGDDTTMARFALRWILMADAVTVAIPGARNSEQAQSNAEAATLPALDARTMQSLAAIYDEDIRPHVHHRW